MKILLASYHFHLQKELFLHLFDSFKKEFIDTILLPTYIVPRNEHDINAFPIKKIKLLGTFSIIEKSNNFIRMGICLIDKLYLLLFLKKWRPNIVILGSDLGGIYIRILQDLCEKLNIPVLIIMTVNYLPAKDISYLKSNNIINWLLSIFGMKKAVLFQEATIGKYLSNSIIGVSGYSVKEQLINEGINSARIHIVGNPLHDKMLNFIKISRIEAIRSLQSVLPFSSNIQIITYCTEVVEEIYGSYYNSYLNEELKRIFDDLPDNIKIVIKLHPRESQKERKALKDLFYGDRYYVIENIDLPLLLRASLLMITHVSATILDAILLNTPILRINIQHDKQYDPIVPNLDIVTSYSFDDFNIKLNKLINGKDYRNKALQSLREWIKNYSAYSDGDSTARIKQLIAEIVET